MDGLVGTSFVFGPLIALLVIGLLALVLRWAFGRGGSLVPGPARRGPPDTYGLLVEVASPTSDAEASALARRLATHGIRATIAPTTSGRRVMVWPDDAPRAADLLR